MPDISICPVSPEVIQNDALCGAPSAWIDLVADYAATLAAERAYDAEHIDPHYAGAITSADLHEAFARIDAEVWNAADALQMRRCAAEECIMLHVSPDAAGFALKFLIARGDGREANGWDERLEAEALRFAPPGAWTPSETGIAA